MRNEIFKANKKSAAKMVAAAMMLAVASITHASVEFGPGGENLTSVYLDPSFETSPPVIKLVVDTETGDVKLVGSPGAVMNQYRILSASGSILGDNLISVSQWHNLGLSGLGNYKFWMPMFAVATESDSSNYYSVGDKCCPRTDANMEGIIIFDNLENNTLDLGKIYNTESGTLDFIFTYSYGNVAGYLPDYWVGYNQYGYHLFDYSYPKPDGLDEILALYSDTLGNLYPDALAVYFPNGDGVSSIGVVEYVPEPGSLGILVAAGLSFSTLRMRRYK